MFTNQLFYKRLFGFCFIQFIACEMLIYGVHHILFLTGIERTSKKAIKTKQESGTCFCRQSILL